jgi:alpha-1,2-mannosyltransferase
MRELIRFQPETGSKGSSGAADFGLLPGAPSRLEFAAQWIARAFRDGDWINRNRISFYSKLIVVLNLMVIGACIARGLHRDTASTFGGDFAKCAAASSLALKGHPQDAYDDAKEWAAERVASNDPNIGFEVWDYPPTFLLMVLPFSLLPYDISLLAWGLVTLAVYLVVLRAIVTRSEALWLGLAFPAVAISVIPGQNGLLTMALLAGGLSLLPTRPVLAGIMFGFLTYKPQFGILIPVVLIATGNWRAFSSAAAAAIALVILTALLFGVDTWMAFLYSAPAISERLLVRGETGFGKIQSIFGSARLLNASIATSFMLQAIFSFVVAAVVVWIWRRPVSLAAKWAALVTATLMVTPYAMSYDFVLMAAPIAWLSAEGLLKGFLPWEKSILLLIWLFPMIRLLLPTTGLPLTPIVLTIALLAIVRRVSKSVPEALPA